MEVPKGFRPTDKDLEGNVKRLLSQKYSPIFNNLEIEPGINKGERKAIRFNWGLKNIRRKGYERHIRPWESFGLIIGYLEGKLKGTLNGIAEEILASSSEWFDMAVEKEGNKLICYLAPENLKFTSIGGRYVIDGTTFKYSEKKEFRIPDIPERWVALKEFNDNFVKYFYTRRFEDLPREMRKDLFCEAKVYLPLDGLVCPIGRGGKFGIHCYSECRTSRGVKER